MRIDIPGRVQRIALALGALWLAGCLAHALFPDATVRIRDALPWRGASNAVVTGCGDAQTDGNCPPRRAPGTPDADAKTDPRALGARTANDPRTAASAACGIVAGWMLAVAMGWLARGVTGSPRGRGASR